jgi:uncharacterized protein
MRIIRRSEFKTTRWKNGGGITHEIARLGQEDDFAWRLSIAEVRESGPFSLFILHDRILTVIDGAGMTLVSDKTTLPALPFTPVRFSGRTTIRGELIDGPCSDFNLIYDPHECACNVEFVKGPAQFSGASGPSGLYFLSGEISATSVAPGDFVFLDAPHDTVVVPANAACLLIRIDDVSEQ